MCSEHDAEPEGRCFTVMPRMQSDVSLGGFARSEGKMATFDMYFVPRRYNWQGLTLPVTRFDTISKPSGALDQILYPLSQTGLELSGYEASIYTIILKCLRRPEIHPLFNVYQGICALGMNETRDSRAVS